MVRPGGGGGVRWGRALLKLATTLTFARALASAPDACIDESYAAKCTLGTPFQARGLEYNPRHYFTAGDVEVSASGKACQPDPSSWYPAYTQGACEDTGNELYSAEDCPEWAQKGRCTNTYEDWTGLDWREWMSNHCCKSCKPMITGRCRWNNLESNLEGTSWDIYCSVDTNGTKEKCDVQQCHTLRYCLPSYQWLQDAREDSSQPASVKAGTAQEFIAAFLNPRVHDLHLAAPVHLNAENLPTVPLIINHQVHIHSTEANALRVVIPPRHVFVCSENCTLEVDRLVVSLPTTASVDGDASPTGGVIMGFMVERGGKMLAASVDFTYPCSMQDNEDFVNLSDAVNMVVNATEPPYVIVQGMEIREVSFGADCSTATPPPPPTSKQNKPLMYYIVAAVCLIVAAALVVIVTVYNRGSFKLCTVVPKVDETYMSDNLAKDLQAAAIMYEDILRNTSPSTSNQPSSQFGGSTDTLTTQLQSIGWQLLSDSDGVADSRSLRTNETEWTKELDRLVVSFPPLPYSANGSHPFQIHSNPFAKASTFDTLALKELRQRSSSGQENSWTPSQGEIVTSKTKKYRLGCPVGDGTHAMCFSGVDIDTNFGVCLKISKYCAAHTLFQSEALIMKQLSTPSIHPHLAQLHESFEYRKLQVVVMPFYGRGDLGRALASRDDVADMYASPEGLPIALTQLVLALQGMHSKNIMHRDVKMSNIFISDEGYLVLGDFGSSRELFDEFTTTFAGTPLTMAPEVLQLKPYSFSSDVYSLGVVLYELCTRESYIEGNTMSSLLTKHMVADPAQAFRRECGMHVPVSIARIVTRMLAANPDDRPTANELMSEPVIQQGLTALVEHIKNRLDYLGRTMRASSGSSAADMPKQLPQSIPDDEDRQQDTTTEEVNRHVAVNVTL